MKNNDNFTDLRAKPLLTVKELQLVLRLGRTNTYAFLKNNPPFRTLHVKNSIRIPSKSLFDWIDGNEG